ncbi:adenylate/guanylate cyclase domain-containing protein [Bradyrhizobium iriomotense]|uniref:adenylate/guanylate cyclase domain-containing protein n=1 Tax=Bradyrhizobium iriomotense TaxID=441950 RepID=UPI001B8A7683|nr:adenylate/guanylate cyclase domain-containing protein [Bradyrhizobium iriomotense]MBR0784842.1 AAA family ATPase [Bradyrhizobium iriomotense]
MDIGEWLRSLGLQSYEQRFRDNGIDLEILSHLTVEDLKEIGVQAVGHRRKLLDAIGLLPADLAAARPPASVERRQLTLMFVDLVGSTDLSRRLDPEELREVMRAYSNTVAGEIARLEGHVAKFLGDGVQAYFGWPRASEDAAEQAVRAGLAVATAVSGMSSGAGGLLAARVGIATGLVVVGDLLGEGAAREEAVTGETPNLAARLQQVAEPGTVVIADSTRRLVGDLFEFIELGSLRLKGFAEPVQAWRVIGEGRVESRFEALHGAHVTPLVGRSEELDLTLSRWRLAKGRAGQVVLIFGEPGIGKSRLVLALRERLQAEQITLVSYACSPHHLNSPLFPFISQLEREARFAPEDTAETRLKRLELLLGENGEGLSSDAIQLLADLLGIPNERPSTQPEMSPQQRKALLFRTFLARLNRLAARGPVLMVLEDAHWLDPTSRELFDQIVDRLQDLPVLVVATFRPELPPPWTGFPHVTLLMLNRLPQAQVVVLVDRITEGKALPAEVLDQILARTEGVPLFTEELTKAVLEAGILRYTGARYVLAGAFPSLAIPATLHDSLMARLDRLAPVKEVAQIGACIGREFDHELLAAVVSMPGGELAAALDRLVAAELVFRRGLAPAATYVFKHALVRDAAYESLLKRRRQELHARIATSIEALFPQLVEAQPELVARHFGEAGLAERAIPYWLKAGRLAAARSANMEAIAHLRSGLECAQALPSGASRSRFELALQLGLGGPLIATKGFASREAEAAFQRAQELSRELQSEVDLSAALKGLGHVYHVRANLREVTSLVEETEALAKRSGDPVRQAEADHLAGVLSFHLGQFQFSRDRLERSAQAGEYRGRYYSEVYGIDMSVFCRAYMSHCDWHLGYPVRSLGIAEKGLAVAREISHPFSIALALNYLAMLYQFRQEPDAALKAAAESRDICAEYRFDYYGAWASLVRAWAIAEFGRLEEGLADFDAGLEDFRRTSAGLRIPHHLGLLAALHRKAGNAMAGLRVIDEAVAIADASLESWCAVELHRERGELLLLAAGEEAENQADAEFEAAIEIAAAQGARLPELRASVARARLQAARGMRREARDALVPIYSWFREGLETRDLVEARKLLADL